MQMHAGAYVICALSILAAALTGCTIGSPGGGGGTGGGYEKQIDSTTFVVTDYGGATSTYRKVNRWNLMHCAYVADGRGFDYFVVVDAPKVDTIKGDALSGYLSQSDYGNHVRNVGDGWTSYQISRTIRIHRGTVPADNPSAFDARKVIQDSAAVSDP
jgi:hypothetical protein